MLFKVVQCCLEKKEINLNIILRFFLSFNPSHFSAFLNNFSREALLIDSGLGGSYYYFPKHLFVSTYPKGASCFLSLMCTLRDSKEFGNTSFQ